LRAGQGLNYSLSIVFSNMLTSQGECNYIKNFSPTSILNCLKEFFSPIYGSNSSFRLI
jgi:hypothetical protein